MYGLSNMALFLIIINYIAALVAVQFLRGDFGNDQNENFGEIWNAFLAMYQVFSSENWTNVLYSAGQAEQPLGQSVIALICESFLYLNTHQFFEWMTQIYHIRLGFLTVEGVDLAARKHIGEYEVLQDLYALWRTGLIVILERVEEVLASSIPLAYGQIVDIGVIKAKDTYSRSPIHILPPHSLMTPIMRGCGIAERTAFDAL